MLPNPDTIGTDGSLPANPLPVQHSTNLALGQA